MNAHTPGPWKHVATQGGWDGVEEPGGQLICHLRLNNPANATLIAAAPALLAALEAILPVFSNDGTAVYAKVYAKQIEAAEQAIAKAKGE